MKLDATTKLLILFVAWLLLSGGGGASKVTAAVYTHEQRDGGVPSDVQAAISAANARGILATVDEVDTTDGAGEVPDQYKLSRPAAVAKGLPSLVVLAGQKVLRVVKDPKASDVEAVK